MNRLIPSRLKSHNGKNSRNASPSRTPDSSLVLRVTVIKARNLAAKDRGGTSDPYLVLTLGEAKAVTHAVDKNLNPEWNVSFDLPINGSTVLEAVCWDKDRFGKDYLGEFKVHLTEAFNSGVLVQEPQFFPLSSSRKDQNISGDVELQLCITDTSSPPPSTEQILEKWLAIVGAGASSPKTETDIGDDDSDSDGKSDTESKSSRKERKRKNRAYQLSTASDVIGVLYLEITSVSDLPPEKNMTRTGFDMDPFVVASLGKKTYRTRVIRHNLNPVWEEKLVFQVLRHEEHYSFSFSVVDRDKLSGNDFVADCNFPVQEVISICPDPDPETGLYDVKDPPESTTTSQSKASRFKLSLSRTTSASSLSKLVRPGASRKNSSNIPPAAGAPAPAPMATTSGENLQVPVMGPNTGTEEEPAGGNPEGDELKTFKIPLRMKNKDMWEDKHSPELTIRAKYVPYPALRQQFWRMLLKQYDADGSGLISKVELSTMLDVLGSTLKESTIDQFFKRFASEPDPDVGAMELTFDQVVVCLEDQLDHEVPKRTISDRIKAHLPDLGMSSSSGDASTSTLKPSESAESGQSDAVPAISPGGTTLTQEPLGMAGEEGELLEKDDLMDDKGEEHVIQIIECPVCHEPRLNKRSETDIVTHIATCASQDWKKVNNLVMGGFVTSSQAQKKWYSKVVNKISYGGYKLGANSANILVQDRLTGLINEERMSVYVRLGIRLLYKGLKSREMEKKRIRKLLKSLSIKQGVKFDDPGSAAQIPSFIEFHQLNMDEVLLPMSEFKTFNEFFYRALKPGERPCSAPDNSKIIVSPADCRSVVFNTIDEATKIWVKGREFSVARLFGDAYPEDVARYNGGALGIFRLAPQDYHRFHIPVDGVLAKPKLIEGEYYTVNPMAIRSALDVYGENIRVLCPIDSLSHGRVMMICVGAMMVGSTVITASEGQQVKRAEELGYFKFGGSTILLLFEPGVMVFDDDLVDNSNTALETLIRVGMSIGHSPDEGAFTPDQRKENVTQEEKLDAQRRIGGSLAQSSGTSNPVPPM